MMDAKAIEKMLEKLLDKKLSSLNKNITSMNTTLRKVEESIEFLSVKYDDLVSKIDTLESEGQALVKENLLLKSDVKNLSHEMKLMEGRLDDMEQYSRRECLEIRGIPTRVDPRNENTNDIVIKVGNLIGVQLNDNDISIIEQQPREF